MASNLGPADTLRYGLGYAAGATVATAAVVLPAVAAAAGAAVLTYGGISAVQWGVRKLKRR